jgi:hypothetical protein
MARKPKPPPIDAAEAWRYLDDVGPTGVVELPAIAAAELPGIDLAEDAPPPAMTPRPANEWSGPTDWFARGQDNGRSKLTPANVTEARELRAAGWSTGRLAERYGVARNTICYALNGSTWAMTPSPAPPPAAGPDE